MEHFFYKVLYSIIWTRLVRNKVRLLYHLQVFIIIINKSSPNFHMLKDLGYRFGQQASRPAGFVIIVKSIIEASKTAVAVSC